jgi:CRISPR-associated endonuclease/helicase Cas3
MQRSVSGAFFWGKFVNEHQYLPLAAHCLDVALVFRSLCETDGIRHTLICSAGVPLDDQQLDRLTVLAMLHDIGKANLGFQNKVLDPKAPKAGHVKELAALFDNPDLLDRFMQLLMPEFPTWFSDEDTACSYLMAAFSHHGQPVVFSGERTGTYYLASSRWWRKQGELDPMSAIEEIVRWAREAFPRAFEPGGFALPSDAQFHHRFAGLLMLADWLGSDQAHFPVKKVELEERLQSDREVIPGLLSAVGLDVSTVRPALRVARDFRDRFGLEPRPLQAMIDALCPDDDNTRLVIAESETGSGKTEAALNWFFKLFAARKVDGLYFALPTRVAARELYQRVVRLVERNFPDAHARPATVLAVPGYAQVDGKRIYALPADTEGTRWQDDDQMALRERQWAAERPKRFLAATVAVGTIDQALLSTIQTPHAHLRSVCLDRSLLVVDEVHASDLYMSRLLEALLSHHIGVGGYALLLSATLGAEARQRYVGAAQSKRTQAPDLKTAERAPYPAVTLVEGIPRAAASVSSLSKNVQFCTVPFAFEPERVSGCIISALHAGARVFAILNTVDRVNKLLRALEESQEFSHDWFFSCNGVVCPHHGRFAPSDREILDSEVSKRFGPGSTAGPCLLIGTQTLEQSLDIDADLMISDLAPADVLLQRVGRLHRHQRIRPAGYDVPRCIVLVPENELESALDGKGHVRPDYMRLGYGSVYEDLRALELTRQVLETQPLVSVPSDNRRLVEAVTHPDRLDSLTGAKWKSYGESAEGIGLAKRIQAGYVCIDYTKYFGEVRFNELGEAIGTRLGAGSLQLPLNEMAISPFGQALREVVIPDHMAPSAPGEVITVESADDGVIVMRCADRRYQYSRYGLEVVK